MQADHTTLADLGLLDREEGSLFGLLNFCTTAAGVDLLRQLLTRPLLTVKDIQERQRSIQIMGSLLAVRPVQISNGTFMVIDRFYDTPLNHFNGRESFPEALFYKLGSSTDYSHIKYVLFHMHNLVAGMHQLSAQLGTVPNLPGPLRQIKQQTDLWLKPAGVAALLAEPNPKAPGLTRVLKHGHFIRYQFKEAAHALEELYSLADAFFSIAMAREKYDWTFPELSEQSTPVLETEGLFHPLVSQAVHYAIRFDDKSNFLFLTGANMAGKSTFIKALGLASYLAHTGFPVPAVHFRISLLQGLLSNIHVTDNIARGESYFYNEVQRIKKTLQLLQDGRNWLVLIDELFKGTNVQDAMLCSSTVIEGLRQLPNALFVVSTHLYEIGEPLRRFPNIQFRYFETNVSGEQLQFSYLLREGISQDRLGYLILKREGVVELLRNTAQAAAPE